MTKVLIADDSIDTRYLLNKLLRPYKFSTKFVHSLSAARESLKASSFSVFFLDTILSGDAMDDLIKEAKLAHPDIYIVLMNGENESTSTTQQFLPEADHFVNKPLSGIDIKTILDKILLAG